MNLLRTTVVIARAWRRRLTPSGRRKLRTQYEALHDGETEPGLTRLSDKGVAHNGEVDVAWYAVGPADADVTVVFIHGYALGAESFYDQVNALRDENVRCILIDVRGHGQSSTVSPWLCTVDDAARDVLSVLDEVQPQGKIMLVGHSLGGMISLAVIRLAPSELFAQFESAILIGASMRRFAAKGLARILETQLINLIYRIAERLPERVNKARYEFAQFVAPLLAAVVTEIPSMAKVQFHAAMLLDTPLPSFLGFFDDLLDHSEFGAAERLAQLRGKIVVGSLDMITPASQSQLISAHWPGADLIEVEGSGHMVVLEDPEAISAIIGEELLTLR